MDGSKAKKYAEEIKEKINGLIPTVENKEKLINQLCEKDEENGGCYVDLIEKAFEEEEANQQENIQNSTKVTINKIRSEGNNQYESGFNRSSYDTFDSSDHPDFTDSSFSEFDDEKSINGNNRNNDNIELIEKITDRILEILEYELGEEDEESLKNFLMEVFRYFNCKP